MRDIIEWGSMAWFWNENQGAILYPILAVYMCIAVLIRVFVKKSERGGAVTIIALMTMVPLIPGVVVAAMINPVLFALVVAILLGFHFLCGA